MERKIRDLRGTQVDHQRFCSRATHTSWHRLFIQSDVGSQIMTIRWGLEEEDEYELDDVWHQFMALERTERHAVESYS